MGDTYIYVYVCVLPEKVGRIKLTLLLTSLLVHIICHFFKFHNTLDDVDILLPLFYQYKQVN